ncbi:hypothetical protein MKX03_008203, partial [Papaver bracteatum]
REETRQRRNLEILITAERPATPPPPPDKKVCCEACGNAPGCAPKSLPKEAAFSGPVWMSSLVEPTSTKWGHIFCKHMPVHFTKRNSIMLKQA